MRVATSDCHLIAWTLSLMATKNRDSTDIESLARAVPLFLRWILGISGAALLWTGAVAVFASKNGPGTAALVTAGVVLIVVALLVERLESLEAAGLKLGMRAQVAAREKEEAAVTADVNGEPEQAERLRREAAELREVAAATGRTYERIRSHMGSGWSRTRRIEELLEDAMRSAPPVLDAAIVRDLFDEGSDGSRVVSLKLMQRDPRIAHVPSICEAITDSRSAMEQWHALSAAARAVEHGLSAAEEAELREVIQMGLEVGRIRVEDHDRYAAAQRILERLSTVS